MEWLVELFNIVMSFTYSLFLSIPQMCKDLFYWIVEQLMLVMKYAADLVLSLFAPIDVSQYLSGRPGGGKSYEAVAYHVLPALKEGRKVITNLPLQIDMFVKVFGPEVVDLIVVIDGQLDDFGSVNRPFSKHTDYISDWKNEKGQAPLYLIDECHMVLPARGLEPEILEFYSLHRHYGIDIVLITQHLRKIHRDIRDMIEINYICQKNTALGSENSYTRKVKQGASGDVVNTSIRKSFHFTKVIPLLMPQFRRHTRKTLHHYGNVGLLSVQGFVLYLRL